MRKKTDWKNTEREQEDCNEIKILISEIPGLAHFNRDWDNIVTTGLGISWWQKQTDNTFRPIAVAIRFLNDAEKIYSIGELEVLAVVRGIEKFSFYLYDNVVYF